VLLTLGVYAIKSVFTSTTCQLAVHSILCLTVCGW